MVSTTSISSDPCFGELSTPPTVCRMQWIMVKTEAIRRKSVGFTEYSPAGGGAVSDLAPRSRPTRLTACQSWEAFAVAECDLRNAQVCHSSMKLEMTMFRAI